MKIIPVLDLKGGKVVRGQGGRRNEYAPLQDTVLLSAAQACEPNLLLQAFEDSFSFKEFYVADLDGIEGRGVNKHVLQSLRDSTDAKILLDCGIRRISDLEDIPSGFSIIIASETLPRSALLAEVIAKEHPNPVWFSLDLRRGQVDVSENSGFPVDPIMAAIAAAPTGIAGLLAIELERVGGMTGPNFPLVRDLTEKLSVPVYWGGGVRNLEDVQKLALFGCKGCLVSSALHSGSLTSAHLRSFQLIT